MAGYFGPVGMITPEEEAFYRAKRGGGLLDELGATPGINPLAEQLGMQQEPFYSPETGLTQSGLDYIGDLGSALLAGSGWSTTPADFASNFGQAAQQADQSYAGRLRQQMDDRLTGYQLKRQQREDAWKEREYQQQQEAAQANAEFISTLPPELQAAARLNPDAVGTRIASMALPDPVKPEYREVGNQLLEIIPGQAPRVVASAPREAPAPTYKEFGGNLYEIIPGQQPRVVASAPAGSEKPIEVDGALVARQPDGTYKPVYQSPQSSGFSPKEIADFGFKLSGDYRADTKAYNEALTGYQRLEEAAKLDTGSGDIALVYGYMKTLDPTSAVREGEFATAENAAGVPSNILNLYNKAISGERLSPKARQEMIEAGRSQFAPIRRQYEEVRKTYEGRASKLGIDPSFALTPDTYTPPAPLPPPPAGLADALGAPDLPLRNDVAPPPVVTTPAPTPGTRLPGGGMEVPIQRMPPRPDPTASGGNLYDGVTGAQPIPAPTPPPLEQRKVGQVYRTPSGDLVWTGSGWRPAGS